MLQLIKITAPWCNPPVPLRMTCWPWQWFGFWGWWRNIRYNRSLLDILVSLHFIAKAYRSFWNPFLFSCCFASQRMADPCKGLWSFPRFPCLDARWSVRSGIGCSGVSVLNLVINSSVALWGVLEVRKHDLDIFGSRDQRAILGTPAGMELAGLQVAVSEWVRVKAQRASSSHFYNNIIMVRQRRGICSVSLLNILNRALLSINSIYTCKYFIEFS